MRYLVMRGKECDATAKAARERLKTISHDDGLTLLSKAKTTPKKIDALYKLGVSAPKRSNANVVAAITATCNDADPAVRNAAIVAITYVGWPKLRALLHKIDMNDADAVVKKNAAIALGALREHLPE